MIISPRGKILATAEGVDGLAIADIDPRGGREGGDSSNQQKDMRARLFRERNPEAFKILSELNPPMLAKVPPIDLSREEAGNIFARMLTVGDEEFKAAQGLVTGGKSNEAIAAFEKLRTEYRGTWIDRVATERLVKLRAKQTEVQSAFVSPGIASKFPGDEETGHRPDRPRKAPGGRLSPIPGCRIRRAARPGIAAPRPARRGPPRLPRR